MATQSARIPRPIPGVMFGLTHDLDGGLIIREPRILKVGIGLPKGPALNVWIAPDGKWKVRLGYDKEAKTASFANRKDAEDKFNATFASAPVCPYPRKIGYFTFSQPTIGADGREQFVPDFDAIEAHGPTPTEIDIVLLDDAPFIGAFQMWSSSELLCRGDGATALRSVGIAATPEEKELAQEASASGEKLFPVQGCWTGNCPYSKETVKNGKPQSSACKPGGDLKFQLVSNIRVGGTAYFHTTGFRSISSIFSSLHRVSTLTGGRLAGIPLKMVMRPFRANHNGQSATQYAVALEFRAPDVETLRRRLLENVFEIRKIAAGDAPSPMRLIEAQEAGAVEDADDDPPIGAAAIAAEFYPEADDPREGADTQESSPAAPTAPPASSAPAAVATEQKTAGLADRLRRARGREAAQTAQTAMAPSTAVSSAAPISGTVPEDMF